MFVLVYAVLLGGAVPGLRLDRTGAAVLGAIALVACGTLSTAEAWASIDAGTIGLLFGMMVVSAQLRLGGFYTAVTRWLARRPVAPARLLLELMLAIGALSALLTNDVVCLATAPVLIDVCARRGVDPVPFLLGLAAAANVGSAATWIGNPQNMLIGQALDLSFVGYLADGVVPAGLGLLAAWAVLARAYRGAFERAPTSMAAPDQPFDAWQTGKGLALLGAVVAGLTFCPLAPEVHALVAAGVVLCSRRTASRDMLALVDWQLLALFGGLFVVHHAFAAAGHAAATFAWLARTGFDVREPTNLFVAGVVGSNLISNVPLTMLLLPAAEHPRAGAVLALSTTLAGNLLLVGSIANLIVVQTAQRLGVAPRARSWTAEHLRTGLPIALVTLGIAAGWLWLRS